MRIVSYLVLVISLSLTGCAKFCQGYTNNGTSGIDGDLLCGNYPKAANYRDPPRQQVIQSPSNWNAAPTTNLTPGLTSGNTNYQLDGLPQKRQNNNPSPRNCTSQIIGNTIYTNCQ